MRCVFISATVKTNLILQQNILESNTVASRTSGLEVNKNRTGLLKVQGDIKQENTAIFNKNFIENVSTNY